MITLHLALLRLSDEVRTIPSVKWLRFKVAQVIVIHAVCNFADIVSCAFSRSLENDIPCRGKHEAQSQGHKQSSLNVESPFPL